MFLFRRGIFPSIDTWLIVWATLATFRLPKRERGLFRRTCPPPAPRTQNGNFPYKPGRPASNHLFP
jgi:hypothetical protein